jgi:HAD superfamily hydrolase (TIGR01549 family)
LGLADASADLVALMRAGIRERIAAYEGVPELLDELRAAGDRVGVVTNGTEAQQRGKLALTGLAGKVDAVVVSDEVGIAKPDPRIFDLALEALGASGAPRSEVWMVGDAAHADVVGAQAAGIRTAWLAHGQEWDGDTPPDVIAHGPLDAVAAVQSLGGRHSRG